MTITGHWIITPPVGVDYTLRAISGVPKDLARQSGFVTPPSSH
jgi:hypothetical protein